MARFALEIRLGNAAMETPDDVADVLRGIADTLTGMGGDWRGDGRAEGHTRTVRDVNGNRVGGWKITDGEG